MQSAKDSFVRALSARLAALDPDRTVYLDGATRPAIVVVENEAGGCAAPSPGVFYLEWDEAKILAETSGATRPTLALACTISYRTSGSDANSGTDRGRALAALDLELLQICNPCIAAKQDFTQTTPADLGTKIFWSQPQLAAAEAVGGELRRTAKLSLFFTPEMDLA